MRAFFFFALTVVLIFGMDAATGLASPAAAEAVEDRLSLFALGPDGPLWSELRSAYPGRNENEIAIPGIEFRVILGRIIPDIDKYFQALIDHVELIEVRQGEGKMILDVSLAIDSLTYVIGDRDKMKAGQPYGVKLHQKAHLEAYMRRDSIIIDRIRGVSLQVKLPLVSDAIHPRKLLLETSQEQVTIWAEAMGGFFDLVASADVRARKFYGVDWWKTYLRNSPAFWSRLIFRSWIRR